MRFPDTPGARLSWNDNKSTRNDDNLNPLSGAPQGGAVQTGK